jgi:hypothetical protein
MSIIVQGKIFSFIVTILYIGIFAYLIKAAERGSYKPNVRPLPAIEAIPEAVGRAAELGKTVHFTHGVGKLSDDHAPMTMAGMACLSRIAEECGRREVVLRATCGEPMVLPTYYDLVRQGYTKGGHPEMYDDDMVFFAVVQKALMGEVMNYMFSVRPAVSFLFGPTFWETINVLGSSVVSGAMMIGGTARLYYQGFYVALCDYVTIGEELFAAAAICDPTPANLGSIGATDWSKILAFIMLWISVILTTAGTELWNMITRT